MQKMWSITLAVLVAGIATFSADLFPDAAAAATPCPGPAICGKSCSLDPFGTPIYCSNGQCLCAPGYDLQSGVCQPRQPEVTGSEDDYSCPGICSSAVPWATVGSMYKAFDLVPVHGTAPGGEAFMPVWGYQATQCTDHGVGARCSGGTKNGSSCNTSADCPSGICALVEICRGGSNGGGPCFSDADCVGTCGPLTHGQCQGGTSEGRACNDATDCPGGTCTLMGFCSGRGGLCESDDDCTGFCAPDHIGQCSTDGRTCSSAADCPGGTCNPVRTWAGCAPNPRPFCHGIQDIDESGFNAPSCDASKRGNENSVSDFTSAWPFLDAGLICKGDPNPHDSDPSRIDFPNSVIVYRAPIQWEDHSVPDDDYTMNLHSPGHELYDTDTEFAYQDTHGRVHVEYDSDDSVDHFTGTGADWGAANKFWRDLRNVVDNAATYGDDNDQRNVRCFLKSFVNPGLTFDVSTLTCSENAALFDRQGSDGLHDPMTVVVGVPSLDCFDNDRAGTDEIHPA